jgi:hypothetical protein
MTAYRSHIPPAKTPPLLSSVRVPFHCRPRIVTAGIALTVGATTEGKDRAAIALSRISSMVLGSEIALNIGTSSTTEVCLRGMQERSTPKGVPNT